MEWWDENVGSAEGVEMTWRRYEGRKREFLQRKNGGTVENRIPETRIREEILE